MPSRNPRRVANARHLGHLRVHGMCTISAWCGHSGSSLTVYKGVDCLPPDCLRLLAPRVPWWLGASAARSRCAGLRPALARCECTPRCPCAPTPPIRSSLPWQCRSARGLERWDEMNLPWASLTPDRWDVGAPWRGTRSHWRVPKCTARAVSACEGSATGSLREVLPRRRVSQAGRVKVAAAPCARAEQRGQASKDVIVMRPRSLNITRAH